MTDAPSARPPIAPGKPPAVPNQIAKASPKKTTPSNRAVPGLIPVK